MDGGDGGMVIGGRGATGIAEGRIGRGELLGIWRKFGMKKIIVRRAEGEREEERRDIRT